MTGGGNPGTVTEGDGAQGDSNAGWNCICPFCDTPSTSQTCPSCGRDTTARRRRCAGCGRFSPTTEATCLNCGAPFRSELRWKIPLIILLFVVAIVISILLRLG